MGIYKTLGIGIVSYRRPVVLLKLVESIEAKTVRPYRLVIYDNFSDQKTIMLLKRLEREGRAAIIYSDSNDGPYTAYNALFDYFWKHRREIPYCAKIDDDCLITRDKWDDVMLAPFFSAPEGIRDNIGATTCRCCNCGFPVENGFVRQVKSEFFMVRTDILRMVGPFIDEMAHGFRPAYSMDSEWFERFGRINRGIYLVDDVYTAPEANTFQRPENFPGEKAALADIVSQSSQRWATLEAANINHFQRPKDGRRPAYPWRPNA